MTVDIVRVAQGIADVLADTNEFEVVYSLPPPQTESRSATVLPTGGQPDSYCHAALRNDIILVSAPTDFSAAVGWLADRVDTVRDALDADPTCGGVCDGVGVASWGEFYTTTAGGGVDVLALRITLSETKAEEA